VGSEHYSCPSFLADVISPNLATRHWSDPTISELELHTVDDCEFFPRFLTLAGGDEISVGREDYPLALAFLQELGNSNLYFHVLEFFEGGLNANNVLDRLCLRQEFDMSPEKEFNYIASHFSEFSLCDLRQLSVAHLSDLLGRISLKIETEDTLCVFIVSLCKLDPAYSRLLEFVHFEYLSDDMSAIFVQTVTELTGFVNHAIWHRISRRLVLQIKKKIVHISRHNSEDISFPYTREEPLNGIISYLRKKYGGNVHESQVVNVTASSTYLGPASVVADLQDRSYFISGNDPNQWICYDFKDMYVHITGYSIRSSNCEYARYCYPKSWVVEGSDDGIEWKEFDRHENNSQLKGRSSLASFEVVKSSEVRMVRLRQTGKNYNDNDTLEISALELFGSLVSEKPP
jgi:hypothetical protein